MNEECEFYDQCVEQGLERCLTCELEVEAEKDREFDIKQAKGMR